MNSTMKWKVGVDVRKSDKAMAKLKKQVKRTKEIQSANAVAPISVEPLYDDRDFRLVEFKLQSSFSILFYFLNLDCL